MFLAARPCSCLILCFFCFFLEVETLDLRALTSLRVLRLGEGCCLGTVNLSGLLQLQLLISQCIRVAALDVSGCTALSGWCHDKGNGEISHLDLSACPAVRSRPHVGYIKRSTQIEYTPGMSCKCCKFTSKSSSDSEVDVELQLEKVLHDTLERLGLSREC